MTTDLSAWEARIDVLLDDPIEGLAGAVDAVLVAHVLGGHPVRAVADRLVAAIEENQDGADAAIFLIRRRAADRAMAGGAGDSPTEGS